MMCGPPWWIQNNVTPAAPDKDMGGWTACQFSEEQQAKFGCDADGEVKSQGVHDAALKSLAEALPMQKMGSTYIAAGGDLASESLTVEEAVKKAAEIPGCKGFCFEEEDAGGAVLIYFKDNAETFAGPTWTSYIFPVMAMAEPEEICGGPVCGGAGDAQDGNEDLQSMCEALKADITKAAQAKGWNGLITSLEVDKYKQQVVAGTNYFVRVKINEGGFFHLRIYEPLPHTGEPPSLANVLVDAADTPLDFF